MNARGIVAPPWRRGAWLLLWAVALTLPAAAADAAEKKVDPKARLTAGALLAEPCATCHGTDGRSPGSIPAVYGRPADAVEELLLKYRSGELKGTVMNRISAGYTPEQIKAIAQHLGGVK